MTSYASGGLIAPSKIDEDDLTQTARRVAGEFGFDVKQAGRIKDGLRLSHYVRSALPWAELGHVVVPATHAGKDPSVKFGLWSMHAEGRHHKVGPREIILQVLDWWSDHKVDRGLLILDSHNDPAQHLVVMDVDDPTYWPWVRQTFGDSGVVTWSGRDVPHGSEKPGHLFFRAGCKVTGRNGHIGPPEAFRWPEWRDDEPKSPKHWGTSQLDVKAAAGYVVAPGSVHKTGRLYTFSHPLTQATLDALPVFDAVTYEAMCAATKAERQNRKAARLTRPTLSVKARVALAQNLQGEIDQDTLVILENGTRGTLKAVTAALKPGGRTLSAFCPEHHNTDSPAASVGKGFSGRPFLRCYSSCDTTFSVAAVLPSGVIPIGVIGGEGIEALVAGAVEESIETLLKVLEARPDPRAVLLDGARSVVRHASMLSKWWGRRLARDGMPVVETKCGFDQIIEDDKVQHLACVNRPCRKAICHTCQSWIGALRLAAILSMPLQMNGRLGAPMGSRALYFGAIGDTPAAVENYKRTFRRGHERETRKYPQPFNVSVFPLNRVKEQGGSGKTDTPDERELRYDPDLHAYTIWDFRTAVVNNPISPGRWVLATAPWGLNEPEVVEGTETILWRLSALMVGVFRVQAPTASAPANMEFGFDEDLPDQTAALHRVIGRIGHPHTLILDPESLLRTATKTRWRAVRDAEGATVENFVVACNVAGIETKEMAATDPEVDPDGPSRSEHAAGPSPAPRVVVSMTRTSVPPEKRDQVLDIATQGLLGYSPPAPLNPTTALELDFLEDLLAQYLDDGPPNKAPQRVGQVHGTTSPEMEAALDEIIGGVSKKMEVG